MTVSEKINQLRDNAAVKGLTAPAQAAPKVAKTASVAVSGKAFKKKSKPKVTVTIKVSDGTVKGRVAIFVGGKKVKV
ncbi:MAG: hypothetical protein LBR20_05330, partial [Propionibacteriaceae bacterium]|nr:hypothetical protein [Propionibacteriaceae bacterium]